MVAKAFAIGAYFALRVVFGIAILSLSGRSLDQHGFTIFTQLFVFAAYLNTLASGGVQQGLIRDVAAAATTAQAARAVRAALVIWATAALVLVGLSAALAVPAAEILTGETGLAWAIPAIALLSMAGGPAQIIAAALTGAGRTTASMTVQAASLLAGSLAALALIWSNRPVEAVLVYAISPLLTIAVGAPLVFRAGFLEPSKALAPEIRRLLGYSGTFVILASLAPIILFALRYVHRETFGVEALSDWLVANRISDVTTQLLALGMAQLFLPAYAAATTDQVRRRLALRAALAGMAMMAAVLGPFAVAPGFFLSMLLSPDYADASAGVLAYMGGDIARAVTSLAMFAALAQARFVNAIAIEAGILCLFGGILLTLAAGGIEAAPFIAYPVAYLLMALLVCVLWMARRTVAARAGLD